MREFINTTAGRLLNGAAAIMLIGGGASCFVGHGAAFKLLVISFILAVNLTVVGVGLAFEKHWRYAMATLVIGPLGMFGYFLGMIVASQHSPGVGWGTTILGLAPLALAAVPSLAGTPKAAASRS
jgi:heme/copper-type cytochrome/quinol oxidase subunit 4